MKAFQLKIMLKDSKPPIWRRVVVPAGITFSQLSMILNEAMGWSGYHMFEMEFNHSAIRIMEDSDDFNGGWSGYRYLEASTTFIREFLEEHKWFHYIYDMGDYWQHRVTIEKVLDDYELDYPIVLKYKGNCPPEDCGGIWGYYEKLEILKDADDPEHEMISEWMDEFSRVYDMENVNSCLEHEYFYKWGKKETRRQQEIAEDMFHGNYGLCATKRDKNKKVPDTLEEKEKRIEELQAAIERLKREREEFLKANEEMEKEHLVNVKLEDIFHYYDAKTIREIAMEGKGFTRVKSLSKSKLVERLVEHMLKPEEMERYFLCLNDDQIMQFEAAADGKRVYHYGEADGLFQLHAAAYVGELEDGRYVVPVDVKTAYDRIDTIEFHKRRKKISFLYDCSIVAANIYGITPIHVFKQITDKCLFMEQMSELDIREILSNIPEEYKEFVIVKDEVHSLSYYPDDCGLSIVQKGKPFYIPSSNEVREFAKWGYFPDNDKFKELIIFLMNHSDFTKQQANAIGMTIQGMLRVDCTMDEIFAYLDEIVEFSDNKKKALELIDCILELNNYTRKIANRGFTPNEIGSGITPKRAKRNVVNIEDACRKKVYANDPCPCGSGLKYKKCCGRKR